jgi:preprotein translocase subunit SecF
MVYYFKSIQKHKQINNMKKSILTIAFLLTVSAISFSQTAGQKLDKGVEKTKQAGRKVGEETKEATQDVKESGQKAGHSMKMGAKKTARKVKRSVHKTAKKVEDNTQN